MNLANFGIIILAMKPTSSFNDLVGAAEDRSRDLDADRVRRALVDNQLEPGRLLRRRLARPCPLQHLVGEGGAHGSKLALRRPVGSQAASLGHLPPLAHCRKLLIQTEPAE